MLRPMTRAFTVATWNVNSIRTRMPHVVRWLDEHRPDVLLVQETKVDNPQFPHDAFAARGLHVAIHGQKSYNGVAIVSRHPLADIRMGFNGEDLDGQTRIIAATVQAGGQPLRVISAYVPNGESPASPKFDFKQRFYARLTAHMQTELAAHARLALGGDFNISWDERDVDDPARRIKECMFTPAEQQWLRQVAEVGLHDALRLTDDAAGIFSWWDYRELGFAKNRGMRIDYVFVSAALKALVQGVEHHRDERKQTQPSDHIPVLVRLAL